jgi:hypothetical protein
MSAAFAMPPIPSRRESSATLRQSPSVPSDTRSDLGYQHVSQLDATPSAIDRGAELVTVRINNERIRTTLTRLGQRMKSTEAARLRLGSIRP